MALAIPPSLSSGFGQAAWLYDGVGINTHFIYINTPYGNYHAVIDYLAELGVRHIREGIIASWFDARSGSSDVALRAVHARNLALPDGQQPIFVLGGTTEFPPQQNHPFTTADWFATMDGGHQHYNNDSNSGIPGAIPGVGGPLSDATYPFATPEVAWGLFSGIQSSNEPQGDVSQIPSWQNQLLLGKSVRTNKTVFEGLAYVTSAGVEGGPATADQLPVVGSVAMTNSTWDTWGDLSAGTGNVDAGDLHIYMGGSNPSVEHVNNEYFNARSYNGRLKLPHETHYPADALPFFVTETGYITSGTDSAHFPAPDDVIGKYLVTTLLIHAKKGIRRTFLYELLDEADLPTISEVNFGLVRFDGTPKASFYAIRNYLALTGFSEAPAANQQPLDYAITGFTAGPNNFQTNLSNGSHYDTSADRLDNLCVQQDAYRYVIWVWRQINLWDRENQVRTTPNTQSLTVDFGDTDIATVSVAQPCHDDPDQGLAWTPVSLAGSTATFSITDQPVALAVNVRPPTQNPGTMATFTLNRSDVFPPGTSVGLYTQLNPATQTPLGPLNQAQTVNGSGAATFTGLSEGVTYYAFAYVNGVPYHVSFLAPSTSDGGGGGVDVETDPLSVKLVPSGAQTVVPSIDVPALTVKSYSGAAQGASMFEARDASASDAVRVQVLKEGTLNVRRANAFFPNIQGYNSATDTQPAFVMNGNFWSFGPGGSTSPDVGMTRYTDGNGFGRISFKNNVSSANGFRMEIEQGGFTAVKPSNLHTPSATPFYATATLDNAFNSTDFSLFQSLPTYIKTDTASDTTLMLRAYNSTANIGDATHKAKGTIENFHSGLVITDSTASSEHCGYIHQHIYNGGSGRTWATDFNIQSAPTQMNMLSGVNMFINNYYNGSPTNTPSYAFAAMTGQNNGGALGASTIGHGSLPTYPLDVGYWVLGRSSAGTDNVGYTTAFRAGQGSTSPAGGWNIASSRIGTGLLIDNYTVNGINVNSRSANTGAGIKLAAGLDLQLVESAGAPTAVADSARVFSKDNGSGKTQLCVQFGTGSPIVIATEA